MTTVGVCKMYCMFIFPPVFLGQFLQKCELNKGFLKSSSNPDTENQHTASFNCSVWAVSLHHVCLIVCSLGFPLDSLEHGLSLAVSKPHFEMRAEVFSLDLQRGHVSSSAHLQGHKHTQSLTVATSGLDFSGD